MSESLQIFTLAILRGSEETMKLFILPNVSKKLCSIGEYEFLWIIVKSISSDQKAVLFIKVLHLSGENIEFKSSGNIAALVIILYK